MEPYLSEEAIGWPQPGASIPSSCGALVAFFGVVRAERCEGRSLAALTYEAHPEMANRQCERLIREAQSRWPEVRIWLRHRIGRVAIGEIGLLIVAAAPHRAEAYAASRYVLERVKKDVPIWKCEHYDDGALRWKSGTCAEELCNAYV